METRRVILVIMVSFFFSSGCGHDVLLSPDDWRKKSSDADISYDSSTKTTNEELQNYDTRSFPNPIVLTRADIKKTKVYIHNAKETLKIFDLIVNDTNNRRKDLSIDELGREAHKYIEIYVKPLIYDYEGNNNSETKIEIAKLHLLSAFLYLDLGEVNQAMHYLGLIRTRYASDSYLLGMTIDQKDIGFNTLGEGIKDLMEKISVQAKNK
jgi:hypothetical protein